MSYDFSVKASTCDHQVSNERYEIDTEDFRSLRFSDDNSVYMRAPINASSTLRVFIGGLPVPLSHPRYGYQIVKDTTRSDEADQFLRVVFNQPVRLTRILIEIQYFTLRIYCLKCMGTGKVNDFIKSNSGGLLHLIGNEKLIQKCMKWVLTSSCAFYPNFTCPIKTYIGRKFGLVITDSDISHAILNSLQTMKKVQANQATVQQVDQTETLKELSGVSAVADPNNPTLVRVSINITANKETGTGMGPINFNLRAAN